MGMALGQGSARGSRRHHIRRRHGLMTEINVTPMVDVMLVLLIIFMVTAPLLTVGVPIELPETKAKAMESDKEPLTISVDPTGKVFLQDTEISLDELVPKLQAISNNDLEARVFVRGDRDINYGTVMKVMGTINAAGYKRIGLVTTLENE